MKTLYRSHFPCAGIAEEEITVADPREGLGGPAPSPLFLDQTEALRAKNIFWPPHLKV